MKLVLNTVIILCAVVTSLIAKEESSSASSPVDIGIASWNIELFDTVGPNDQTFPKREQRHLTMMAETLLGTGADVIGLQEIMPPRSDSEPCSLDLLVSEMNRLEKTKQSGAKPQAIWKGKAGKITSKYKYPSVALMWNTKTLELLGKVTELTQLKRGYGFGKPTTSREELRFPRAPLVARFRVRSAPANDFVVIVLHLKAKTAGLDGGLDTNDIRRRGEWESLLREWLMKPEAQGPFKDEDIIVMGDLNESNSVIIELLDKYGTGDDVRNRMVRDVAGFDNPRALLLFTSGKKEFPYFTYQWNGEKGEHGMRGELPMDILSWKTKFLDHILISRSLVDNWDKEFTIDYFEKRYPFRDHIRLSDHRPVSIRLRFPLKNSREHNANGGKQKSLER
jgi:endonuclease/exonuclease/phosphatase family metal-dependent hydrolase